MVGLDKVYWHEPARREHRFRLPAGAARRQAVAGQRRGPRAIVEAGLTDFHRIAAQLAERGFVHDVESGVIWLIDERPWP